MNPETQTIEELIGDAKNDLRELGANPELIHLVGVMIEAAYNLGCIHGGLEVQKVFEEYGTGS